MSWDDELRKCGAAHGEASEALGRLLQSIVEQLELVTEAVAQGNEEGFRSTVDLLSRAEALEKRIGESVLPALDSLRAAVNMLCERVDAVEQLVRPGS